MTVEQATKKLSGNASVNSVTALICKETGRPDKEVRQEVRDWLFKTYPNATTIISRSI